MLRNTFKSSLLFVLAAFVILGCDSGQQTEFPGVMQAPPAQIPPVQNPVPVAAPPQPVAAPATPPPTPLMPVAEASKTTDNTKRSKGKGDTVDKPLPGPKTPGDELVGNYSCKLNSKGLPLGPFKLPAFGCRIFKADDGGLKLGPTSRSIATLRGTIKDSTAAGFFVIGGYKFPGNNLSIKARMQRKPGGKAVYSGKGRGMLNKDKSSKIQYTLTMTRQ